MKDSNGKPTERTHHFEPTQKQRDLDSIYSKIRKYRDGKIRGNPLPELWGRLQKSYSDDWLAPLGILELLEMEAKYFSLQREISESLRAKQGQSPVLEKLIADGLEAIRQAA